MPIKFISLNYDFVNKIKALGFEAFDMKIEEYKPVRHTYYVSPANSLCFMDGGIDLSLSRNIFPGIEQKVKDIVNIHGKTNLLGRKYLPIGSSIIVPYDNMKSLIVSPTMLLPQNVSETQNAYYSVIAVLYNILINNKKSLDDIDIIFTSMCCGFGKMSVKKSIVQTLKAINNYEKYNPFIVNNNIILNEPTLRQQPKIYQNTEWFPISSYELKHIINN